jgi:pilus assembly protein CpaB
MPLPRINVNKNWLLLGLAVVLGIGAMFLSNSVIKRRMGELEAESKRGQSMVTVVVANRDLDKGETITADDLAARPVPAEWVHSTAVKPDEVDQYVMQRLSTPIKRGEVLLQSHLDGKGSNVFSANLKKGWRALTFEVDTVNSISGMMRPGDHIDLIYTGKTGEQTEEQTLPLLSDVNVLATGQSITKTDDATGKERTFSTVTLEVSPLDADRIIVAKSGGRVTAVLRHPDDVAANATRPLVASNLLGSRGSSGDVQYIIGGGGGPQRVQQGEMARLRAAYAKDSSPGTAASANGSGVAPVTRRTADATGDATSASSDTASNGPAGDGLRLAAAPATGRQARAAH